MSSVNLRNYRVSLVGSGAYAIWIIAESRRAACDLAERIWSENRSMPFWQDGGTKHVELLDEYDHDDAA